jgi:hypothetical protein
VSVQTYKPPDKDHSHLNQLETKVSATIPVRDLFPLSIPHNYILDEECS